jgi:IS5 family transposase
LARQGYIARGGQILDASIAPVGCPHNTRDENAAVKKGEVPEDWADKPAKLAQKDVDARWTKKHGKSHYGAKHQVNVDRMHKLARRCHVTDAAVHDNQAVDRLLMQRNTGSGVWGRAPCRCEPMEAKLRDRKPQSNIHRKGNRSKPVSDQTGRANRTKSTVRVRVDHIFGGTCQRL